MRVCRRNLFSSKEKNNKIGEAICMGIIILAFQFFLFFGEKRGGGGRRSDQLDEPKSQNAPKCVALHDGCIMTCTF